MENPVFFDAACQVGKNLCGVGEFIPDVLKEMDRMGVAKALVRDKALKELGAEASNRQIVEMLKKEDPDRRLYGVWCLLPEQCGELPPPKDFFDSMAENRIYAVTLQPFNHRWIPCKITIQNYMAEALRRRVPVLLDGLGMDWTKIYTFLQEFPDNIYIAMENFDKWGPDRNIRTLLDGFRNLYFSFDGYWVPEGIPELVKHYGAERFVFGSRFPQYSAGSAMLQLKHAGLSEKEFAMIASGNLEKLLKGETK